MKKFILLSIMAITTVVQSKSMLPNGFKVISSAAIYFNTMAGVGGCTHPKSVDRATKIKAAMIEKFGYQEEEVAVETPSLAAA